MSGLLINHGAGRDQSGAVCHVAAALQVNDLSHVIDTAHRAPCTDHTRWMMPLFTLPPTDVATIKPRRHTCMPTICRNGPNNDQLWHTLRTSHNSAILVPQTIYRQLHLRQFRVTEFLERYNAESFHFPLCLAHL